MSDAEASIYAIVSVYRESCLCTASTPLIMRSRSWYLKRMLYGRRYLRDYRRRYRGETVSFIHIGISVLITVVSVDSRWRSGGC